MKTRNTLLGTALLSGLMTASICGASLSEPIDLQPFTIPNHPQLTKMVKLSNLPSGYVDAAIKVSYTIDRTGVPHDIQIIAPKDPALTQSVVSAISQWRFKPVYKAGVAVETKVIQPLRINPVVSADMTKLQRGSMPKAVRSDPAAFAAPTAGSDSRSQQLRKPLSFREAFAGYDSHPALIHLDTVTCYGSVSLKDGDTEAAVIESLGLPRKLAENVWAYASFQGVGGGPDRHACHTLLVTLRDGRIAALALGNETAVSAAAVQLHYDPNYLEAILMDLHKEMTSRET